MIFFIYSEKINLVTTSSFFFIVFAIVTFITRPFTGKIYDNYGENKVMYPVLLSFTFGLIILGFTHTSMILLIAAALIGFGYRYLYIAMGILVIIALILYYYVHGRMHKNPLN